MRVLRIAFVVLLAAALPGCSRFTGKGGKPKKQDRPITVVLVQSGGGACEAKFSKKPQHAYAGDTIIWEFINTCPDKGSPRQLRIDVKSSGSNPFSGSPPWNGSVNAGATAEIGLDIEGAASPGTYSFDIFVDNAPFDPKLEIDPYS